MPRRTGPRPIVFARTAEAVWIAAALFVSGAPLRAAEPTSLAGRRPNVVLILTDDQGYGDLACHGNPIAETPHLDRLHAESVRFLDFQVSPTCAPTRAALLTGRHEFRSGVTHTIQERERLGLHAVAFPALLRQAGYRTALFGKWHLGDEPPYRPDRRGFDHYLIHGAGGIGQSYPGSCGDAPENRYFDPVLLQQGHFQRGRGYCTDLFFAAAAQWIDSVRDQGPFYCQIATNTPHTPLDCPADYQARYTDRVDQAELAKFYGMITNIDDNVGRLLDRLRDWQLERDTLVIFMNDNGGTAGTRLFNAGMRGAKGSPWQGGTRAIAFFRWPGSLEPGDRRQLAAHVDLFPTLLELAGAPLPGDVALDGRSLTEPLIDADAPWPSRTLVTHVGRWPADQAAQWKYRQASIRHDHEHLVFLAGEPPQLFDLREDPGEQRDLAPERPERVAELTREFDAWWESVQPGLVNEDAYRTAPAVNPFRELYEAQQAAGPIGPLELGEFAPAIPREQ